MYAVLVADGQPDGGSIVAAKGAHFPPTFFPCNTVDHDEQGAPSCFESK